MGKNKSTFWQDFKKFIAKGNVIDMAVAVVIGSAFNKIVTSFVNSIITPALTLVLGKVNFSDLKYIITPAKEATYFEDGSLATEAVTEVAIQYGTVIQNIIDFLVMALCIFIALRIIVKLNARMHARELAEKTAEDEKKAAEAKAKADADKAAADAAAAAKKAEEEAFKASILKQSELLEDILDVLKAQSK